MKAELKSIAAALAAAFLSVALRADVPRVIVDTDLGSSVDDLFAIDIAARMHKQGKLNLMAVMMDRPDKSDAAKEGEFLKFADRHLATLGLGDLPIGASMPLSEDRLPQRVFNPYWTLIHSNNVAGAGLLMPTNRTDAQIGALANAVTLYRRLLKDAPPNSVVICSLGFLQNLKALMDSEGDEISGSTGMELIAAKVRELRIMAGCFDPSTAPDGMNGAEYNAAGDPAGTKKVFEEWPTPVVVSTWEVGLALDYKLDDVLADFAPGTFDPVVRATYTYCLDPGPDAMNRLWDVMTVLPLAEGDTLAPLSEKGGISVDGNGVTTFTPDPSSNRCYQVASNMNAAAVMERIRTICQTRPAVVGKVSCAPKPGGSPLADIDFKVTSGVGGTNLVFEVAAYSKDRDAYFTDGDISVDNGASYTQDVLAWYGTAGTTQDVHLVWRWQEHNPDLDWDDVTIEVTAKFQGEDVAVKCRNGTFVGVRDSASGVVAFKSVPYAKPPTKETGLRWKPPVKPDDSDEVFSARHFGPAAAQTRSDGEVSSYGPLSEDCLKLSIWTADGFTSDTKRPVMFFIHGGSYGWGGMSDPFYDGDRLVRDNPGVILVSCDYRLNAFGYLDLTDLPGYDHAVHADYDQAPNLGILDLQAGLKWVQENIAKFGGDPKNVTIFGESAGGGSVSCLLQAKGSEGLFKRAIVMSGTVDLTDLPETYRDSNQAYCLMKAAGKSNIDELLACSTEELIAALNTPLTDPRLATVRHLRPREGGPLVAHLNNRPMCDDKRGIVPSDPFAAFATNAIAKDVDVMIGTTSEELNYWATLMFGMSREGMPSVEDPLGYYYCSFLSNWIGRAETFYARVGNETAIPTFLEGPGSSHPFDGDSRYNLGGLYPNIWGRTELASELSFRIPSIIMAEQHLAQVASAGGTGKTYMYYFCRPWKSFEMPWKGACHACELTSVFKNLHFDVDGGEDAKKTLADNVSGAFVCFAKTGDPGANWATYDTTERQTTVIGTKGDFEDAELRLESDPDADQRKLLQADYLKYREEKLRTGDMPVYAYDLRPIKPYLHEIWYDNYEESDLTGYDAPFGDLPPMYHGGCSSVRVGNYHGRNLDIGISDLATVVVHVKAAEGRFASVGTTQWSDASETALKANEVGIHRFDVLPNWMLDGINEKGVAINVNVIPMDVRQEGDGTDDRPALHARKVVRYVLDHAESAQDAIDKLSGFRIYGNIGTGTYNLHWMISDAEKTFVVEVIGGEVVAREHPIMTNFSLNWDNANKRAILPEEFVNWRPSKYENPAKHSENPEEILNLYTRHAEGVERYIRLRDANYATRGTTFGGMFNLMREVQFTRIAELPLAETFLSDMPELSELEDAGIRSLTDIYAATNATTLTNAWATLQPAMSNVYANLVDYRRPDAIANYSITTHNVTFDLAQKMFRIVVQEEYDEPFDFYLAPTVRVSLPTGVQGYSYVVSNLTAGIEMPAASVLPGGATYELPIGAKVGVYVVPAEGYKVVGEPYVIDEVTAATTVEGATLPWAVDCADTVVYGTIRTAEEGNPVAEAFAVKDGKYVYVGDEAGAEAFIKDGVTRIVDRRGKGMVMPGCTDGHSHYLNTFAMKNMKGGILFDIMDGKDAVLQKLSEATQKASDAGKQSLCGFGWYYGILGYDRPTLQELDEVTHGVSTVIFDSSGHHAFCNSECLRRCGIIDGEGNVLIKEIDGGVLELDGNDYPTGYVNERVTGYLTRMGGINADELIDDEVAEDAILKSQELLLSTGYTMALDGWSNNLHPRRFYEVAHCMDTNGVLKLVLPMTYEVEPWQTNMNEQIDYLASLNETYRTRHVLPEYLKVFMDGVVESRTGATIKPYQKDGKDAFVYKSFWTVDRLADITEKCNAKGLTVHTHVMGDAAIRETVDAYIQGGDGAHRNCLVHLRNVSTNDVNDFQRVADNNIACAAGLTWHATDTDFDNILKQFLCDEYVKHAYPIKSFLDAGVRASAHSDYPANIPSPQDPFGMMQVAVTGMIPDPGELDYPFDTDELITVEQAFQMLTLNGAWQMGLENERGSIAVGKWADFVLADQDVFTCATNDIGKTKVVSTWFEGEKVYEATVEPPEPDPQTEHSLYPDGGGLAFVPQAKSTTYEGVLLDETGAVAGTVSVKLGKPDKKGEMTVSATVKTLVDNKTYSFKTATKKVSAFVNGPLALELVGKNRKSAEHALSILIAGDALSGTFDGATVDGARRAASSKDPLRARIAPFAGYWTLAFGTAESVDAACWVQVSKSGSVHVHGKLADGTSICKHVKAEVGDGWIAAPATVRKSVKGKIATFAFRVAFDEASGTVSAVNVSPVRVADAKTGAVVSEKATEAFAGGRPALTKKEVKAASFGAAGLGAADKQSVAFNAAKGELSGTLKWKTADEKGRRATVTGKIHGVDVDGAVFGAAYFPKTGEALPLAAFPPDL